MWTDPPNLALLFRFDVGRIKPRCRLARAEFFPPIVAHIKNLGRCSMEKRQVPLQLVRNVRFATSGEPHHGDHQLVALRTVLQRSRKE